MSKITESSRGQECQVREPGICNGNPETTVFAHLNGGGMGMKHSDLHGADACSNCHHWLDVGYANLGYTKASRDLAHYQAMVRTQKRLLKEGLITLAGEA